MSEDGDRENKDLQDVDEVNKKKKTKKKFEVKKWNAVAIVEYDYKHEICAICKNLLVNLCISCEESQGTPNECHIVWGTCNHGFHFHCFYRGYMKTRVVCPLDNRDWEVKKHGR